MKVSFLGDLHLDIVDSLSKIDPTTGFSIRTLDRLRALRDAFELSIKNECDIMFLIGDIFDRLNPPESLKKAFFSILIDFIKEINIIILPGNHDGADFTHNYLTEQLFIDKFDLTSIKVIDKPTLYTHKTKFFLMPWTVKLDELIEQIEALEDDDLIGVGHLEIFGALSSTEYKLTQGINPEVFSKFREVFLGHYHRRQTIKNIKYVGSPIIKDFSELGIEKGFIIYDTETRKEKFEILERRKAYQFLISDETLEEVDEFLENNEIEEGSLIKLVFKGTRERINELMTPVVQIFNEYNPLKISKSRITVKVNQEVHDTVLNKTNRIDRIKELAKDKPKEFLDYGLKIFGDAENIFFSVEE